MATNFVEILSGAVLGSIEKPKLTPAGSYIGMIQTLEQRNHKKQDGGITPKLTVGGQLLSALDDVNQDELAAIKGGIQGRKWLLDFWLTEDAIFRLQDFVLEHVGLDLTGQTLYQAIPQLKGNQVGVKFKQEFSKKDPTQLVSFVEASFRL